MITIVVFNCIWTETSSDVNVYAILICEQRHFELEVTANNNIQKEVIVSLKFDINPARMCDISQKLTMTETEHCKATNGTRRDCPDKMVYCHSVGKLPNHSCKMHGLKNPKIQRSKDHYISGVKHSLIITTTICT